MEYTQDEIFNIKYNAGKNTIEVKEKSIFYKIGQIIKKHQFMSLVMILTIILGAINCVMISNFFILLNQI